MSKPLLVAIAAVGVTALVAVVFALGRSDHAATYSADQVRSMFNEQGLSIKKFFPAEGVKTHGRSMLAPANGAYTVMLAGSDAEADKLFQPLLDNLSTNSFLVRDANLIVVSGQNSRSPLPATIRSKIRAAVHSLRRSRPAT